MTRDGGGALGMGYPVAAEALDLEVYQLASTFAARGELARLSVEHPGLRQLSSTFQLSEASRRLIGVAAMARSALDTSPADNLGKIQAGTLVSNIENPKEGVLSFREACNKILHADVIALLDDSDGRIDSPDEEPGILRRSIILEGEKNGTHWRASIDVMRFLEVASRLG